MEYIDWFNKLLIFMEPVTQIKDDTHNFSLKLKDVMKNMETITENMYSYDTLYNEVNVSYDLFSYQQQGINEMHTAINDSLDQGVTLVDEAKGCIVDSENNLRVRIHNLFIKYIVL